MKKTLYTILSIGILLLSVILILPVTVTSVVTVVLGGGDSLVCVPCTGFIDNACIYCKIKHISFS